MAPSDREIYEGCRVANEETTMTEETWAPESRRRQKQALNQAPGFCHKGAEPRQSEGETRRGGNTAAINIENSIKIVALLMQLTARQLL